MINIILGDLCLTLGQFAYIEKNFYTIRHTEFNVLAFSIYWRQSLLILIMNNTQRNMGIKFRKTIINQILTIGFTFVRILVIVYEIGVMLPDFGKFLHTCLLLNKENWWSSEFEPFFCNISPVNAIFCWINWFMWMIIMYYVSFILILVLVVLILAFVFNDQRLAELSLNLRLIWVKLL